MKMMDMTGKRFGRLLVVGLERRRVGKRIRIYWTCHCDCGETVSVESSNLRSLRTNSCGCLQRELSTIQATKHGQSRSALYHIWYGMIMRCTNPNDRAFKNYGGRGITVYPAWLSSFEAFARDMGPRPSPEYSIDRIDNDGNYEPENCRWATRRQQGRNRRGLIRVNYQGKTVCLKEAAEAAGIEYKLAHDRIFSLGWSVDDALSIPAKPGSRNSRWKREYNREKQRWETVPREQ